MNEDINVPDYSEVQADVSQDVDMHLLHTHGLDVTFMESNEMLLSANSIPSNYKIIGQYVIGNTLGNGTYGEVKEALNLKTLQRHAIKILSKHGLMMQAFGKVNLINEIEILTKYQYKNIIKMHDLLFNNTAETIYVVLDYCVCSLEDLLQLSNSGKLSHYQTHIYFVQLIDGLEFLHSNRIIHNDIKPSNILIELSHHLRIADFGTVTICDVFSKDQRLDNNFGTPSFQPPEVISNPDNFFGFVKDIWSTGVTLSYVVTGLLPFTGDDMWQLNEAIRNEDPMISLEDVDPDLLDLILGMLNKDYNKRFTISDIRTNNWFKNTHKIEPFVPFPGVNDSRKGGIDFDEQKIINLLSSSSDDEVITQINLSQLISLFQPKSD